LALVTSLVCLAALGDWCNLTPDSTAYLTTARTLREMGHYPATFMMRPPGFATLIAPLLTWGDAPFLVLRIVFSICWAASGSLTYLLYRRALGERLAWIAGLLVALNTVLLFQTTVVLSEIVFLPLCLIVLLITCRWGRGSACGWAAIVVGGGLAATAIMVRSVGLTLLPVPVLLLLTDRSRRLWLRLLRAALFAACALAPTAAWQVRQSAYPARPGYGHTWTTPREAEHTSATGPALQFERLARYGPLRLAAIKAAVLPSRLTWRAFRPPFDRPTTWLIGGFFVAIALIRVLKDHDPIEAFLLLYLLVLALWPWDEGVRLVVPLVPLLIGDLLWAGQKWWRRRGVSTWERALLGGALALLIVAQGSEMALAQSRMKDHRKKAIARFGEMRDLSVRLEGRLPPCSVLMGITPDGDNSKTILAGAAYLARLPVGDSLDVRGDLPSALHRPQRYYTVVYKSLSDRIARRWNAAPLFVAGDFSVFTPRRQTETDQPRPVSQLP